MFSDNAATASDAANQYKDHILSFGVPALSHAAGSTNLNDESFFQKTFNMHIDMKNNGEWPAERVNNDDMNWKHSDAKDVAYRYVYKLYDTWVETMVEKGASQWKK